MARSDRATDVSAAAATHSATVDASSSAARGCPHGSVGETSWARRSKSSRVATVSADPSASDVGMSPVKGWTSPSRTSRLAPVTQVGNTVTPQAPARARSRSWVGPIHWPPWSTTAPDAVRSVNTRPPTRSRASSTTTSSPATTRSRAAWRPAYPAPATTTSAVRSTRAMSLPLSRPGGAVPDGRVASGCPPELPPGGRAVPWGVWTVARGPETDMRRRHRVMSAGTTRRVPRSRPGSCRSTGPNDTADTTGTSDPGTTRSPPVRTRCASTTG